MAQYMMQNGFFIEAQIKFIQLNGVHRSPSLISLEMKNILDTLLL
jgi:hypothetical protein